MEALYRFLMSSVKQFFLATRPTWRLASCHSLFVDALDELYGEVCGVLLFVLLQMLLSHKEAISVAVDWLLPQDLELVVAAQEEEAREPVSELALDLLVLLDRDAHRCAADRGLHGALLFLEFRDDERRHEELGVV